MSQKHKILIGLCVILAIALTYRLMNPFEQETIERLTFARATKVPPPQTGGSMQSQAELRLDLFRSPPLSPVTIQRDLFQKPTLPEPVSGDKPKPKTKKPTPPPKSDRQKTEEHFRRFKTFGSYRHGPNVYLFLQRGKQVLVITRGDRIDGKYFVQEVSEKAATITAANLTDPLKINFDEL